MINRSIGRIDPLQTSLVVNTQLVLKTVLLVLYPYTPILSPSARDTPRPNAKGKPILARKIQNIRCDFIGIDGEGTRLGITANLSRRATDSW